MAAAGRGGRNETQGISRTKKPSSSPAVRRGCLGELLPVASLAGGGGFLPDGVVCANPDGETAGGLRETLSMGETGRPPLFPFPPDPGAARHGLLITPGVGPLPDQGRPGTGC